MHVCIFEDRKVDLLEPLALTRPAFALRCGTGTILERQQRMLPKGEWSAVVREHLIDVCRLEFPGLACGEMPPCSDTLFVNARWFPDERMTDIDQPRVGMVGDSVAFVLGAPTPPPENPKAIDAWLEDCCEQLPRCEAGGMVFDYLWDIVHHSGKALAEDAAWFAAERGGLAGLEASVVGPRAGLLVADGVEIEPCVAVDTRKGPVMIDRGAAVHAFSRLEGPCYIGPDSIVLGAKVRAETSIGPSCRVGGEIEASIIQGLSNKYHDGFLGHSYVGEWVNLAAGTQTSDLRNDYGVVYTTVCGSRINTQKTKVGSFIGDHTKTGLSALFNTGSVVGVFANVLPNGALSPQIIPSFCLAGHGLLQEQWDMRRHFATASTVMERRGRELTDVHRELYFHLFDSLGLLRRRTIHEAEMRHLRKSV